MKKVLLIALLISFVGFAQDDDQSRFWDHVRFGGGFGFGFGSNQTTLAISPSAIYEFNDQFALGPTFSYLYNKNFDLKSNVFGAGIIGLYNPLNEIQLSAEFEQLFVNQKLAGFDDLNIDIPTLYLGIAYRTGWAAFGIRYDVLYDNGKTVYASAWSPIIRVYF